MSPEHPWGSFEALWSRESCPGGSKEERPPRNQELGDLGAGLEGHRNPRKVVNNKRTYVPGEPARRNDQEAAGVERRPPQHIAGRGPGVRGEHAEGWLHDRGAVCRDGDRATDDNVETGILLAFWKEGDGFSYAVPVFRLNRRQLAGIDEGPPSASRR